MDRKRIFKLMRDANDRSASKLDLSQMKLMRIPPKIGQLKNLTELDLSKNRLRVLPREIEYLRKLSVLSLTGNCLQTLPPEIGRLKQLFALFLNDNQLRELPAEIGQLKKLNVLYLDNNQLQELPAEIGQLQHLTGLFLHGNQLRSLPPEINQLTRLQKLYLQGNPLPIPPEILARVNEPSVIINYYLKHAQSTEKKPLREAKMLIVGQGGVGKTQIVNRLCYDTYHEKEDKTNGIDIHKWTVHHDSREIKLNIWDFGGQEIMHATHQFFLTKRSLYVLVWDARQEDRYGQIDYWLKLIQSFGGDSPVLVVLNKIDVGSLDLDRRELMHKYPNIKEFIRISCKTGQNFDRLRSAIARESSQLPHIDDALLNSWFEIKTRLEQMTRDYLEYREYESICETYGVDKLSQETLIGFLHDLGVVLNFQQDFRLRDVNILNPEWVTKGVYQLLNDELLAGSGILNATVLHRILDPSRYPSSKHRFILDMMKKFELCFEFENQSERFLIPELLPSEAPDFYWDYEDSLGFQYHYNFFPMSIISRFIVRMQPLVFGDTYWKSGTVLADRKNLALVKADRDDRKVYIWVSGQESTRRDFLAKIRAQFEYIHSTIPKIEALEKIPLPENPQIVVDYKHLLDLEELGEESFIPSGLKQRISVKKLLAGIRRQFAKLRFNKTDEYQEAFELLSEKIRRVRKALVLETDPVLKFKFEKTLEDLEQEREKVVERLSWEKAA